MGRAAEAQRRQLGQRVRHGWGGYRVAAATARPRATRAGDAAVAWARRRQPPRGGPLAQLVEQRTFNPRVVGSSPTGPTAPHPPTGLRRCDRCRDGRGSGHAPYCARHRLGISDADQPSPTSAARRRGLRAGGDRRRVGRPSRAGAHHHPAEQLAGSGATQSPRRLGGSVDAARGARRACAAVGGRGAHQPARTLHRDHSVVDLRRLVAAVRDRPAVAECRRLHLRGAGADGAHRHRRLPLRPGRARQHARGRSGRPELAKRAEPVRAVGLAHPAPGDRHHRRRPVGAVLVFRALGVLSAIAIGILAADSPARGACKP